MRRRKGQEKDASVYQEEIRDVHIALLGPHTLPAFDSYSKQFHAPVRGLHACVEKSMTSRRATLAQVHPAMLTFVLCQAHALVAIDEVPAGGSVQARGGDTLVVLLLTVEAMIA